MKTTEFTLKIDDKDVVFEIKKPSLKDRQEADKIYRKTVNQILSEDGNALMRDDLPAFAKKRGKWSDEKEAELSTLEKEISRIEAICSTGFDPINKKKVKLKFAEELAKECREKLRPEMYKLRALIYDLDDLTVEKQGENQRFMALMAASVFYKESGKKVYSNYEDLMNRQDEMLTLILTSRYTGVYYNVDNEYTAKLPENKFLKDWGFIDDKLRYLKDGKAVDSLGRLIDEDGYLINEDGKRVDELGVLIDDSGNYLVDGVASFLDDDGEEIKPPVKEIPVVETKEEVKTDETVAAD